MALPEGARAGTRPRLSSAGLSPANVAHALVWLLRAGEMPPVEKTMLSPVDSPPSEDVAAGNANGVGSPQFSVHLPGGCVFRLFCVLNVGALYSTFLDRCRADVFVRRV